MPIGVPLRVVRIPPARLPSPGSTVMNVQQPLRLALAALWLGLGFARAESVHEAIDVRIAVPDYAGRAAPIASDAEFLRRIYLDLTGTIPAAADVRAFLDDKAADKRIKLIDKLLASPEH